MFQKFFTKTIESKFIKNLIYNTALPIYNTVRDNDYIFKNSLYIYQNNLIKCLKSGYINPNEDEYKTDLANYKLLSQYEFGKYYSQFTEKHISEFGYYDPETHEYLGKYLRCIRDLYNVNLMPFYNCYSNRLADNFSFRIDSQLVTSSVIVKCNDSKSSKPVVQGYYDGYYNFWADGAFTKLIIPNEANSYFDLITTTSYNVTIYNLEQQEYQYIKESKWEEVPDSSLYSYDLIGNSFSAITITSLEEDDRFKKVELINDTLIKLYCDHLPEEDYTIKLVYTEQTYQLVNRSNKDYKVLQIPIRFNTDYTISIDSDSEILLIPAIIYHGRFVEIYDNNQNKIDLTSKLNRNVELKANLKFKHPFKYRLDLKDDTIWGKDSENNDIVTSGIANYLSINERNLYLLIQMPLNDNSSIVVLEGDYTKDDNIDKYYDFFEINYWSQNKKDEIFKSNLSLLKLNDNNIYAFSNRLIEYLTLNAITHLETIDNNIAWAQEGIDLINADLWGTSGIWSDFIRNAYYRSLMKNKKIEHYDFLGYIDKDAEKAFIKD